LYHFLTEEEDKTLLLTDHASCFHLTHFTARLILLILSYFEFGLVVNEF